MELAIFAFRETILLLRHTGKTTKALQDNRQQRVVRSQAHASLTMPGREVALPPRLRPLKGPPDGVATLHCIVVLSFCSLKQNRICLVACPGWTTQQALRKALINLRRAAYEDNFQQDTQCQQHT
jgi:hypothetical protein